MYQFRIKILAFNILSDLIFMSDQVGKRFLVDDYIIPISIINRLVRNIIIYFELKLFTGDN